MPTVKETIFIGKVWDDVERGYVLSTPPKDTFHIWLTNLYHIQLSSVMRGRCIRLSVIPPPSTNAFDAWAWRLPNIIHGTWFIYINLSCTHYGWADFAPPLVRDRALSMIRDKSSRMHHTARPQYIPFSLPVVFSVSSSISIISTGSL